MNNKGFTLIELVGIIIVLAAIFLVSFPAFLNTAKTDEEQKYDDMIENLCLAGKSYIYANTDKFDELSTINSKIEISIKELMAYGNVDRTLKNPKTNQTVEKDSLIYTVTNESLDCQYIES